MDTVSFTQMKDGTKEDYMLLAELEEAYVARTADRVLQELSKQDTETFEGYKVTRLTHATQCATRALRDGADIDWIVSALLHDVGDGLAPRNHDRFSAEVIRPFVREECTWVVEHHGIFQMMYYAHHYGWDKDAYKRFEGHPYFASCADFCDRWDQSSFDPAYRGESLQFFAPMVREVFARKAYDASILQAGKVFGLPTVRA